MDSKVDVHGTSVWNVSFYGILENQSYGILMVQLTGVNHFSWAKSFGNLILVCDIYGLYGLHHGIGSG